MNSDSYTKRAFIVPFLTSLYRRQGGLAPMARTGYNPYERRTAVTNSVSAVSPALKNKITSLDPLTDPKSPRNATSMSKANPVRPVAEFGNALRDRRQNQLGTVMSWGK